MWLFIESIHHDQFRVGLLGVGNVQVKRYAGKSNKILPAIARVVSPKKMAGMDGICAVQGPGSFTSVRTGALIANLLSRIFCKPLVGISADEARNLRKLGSSLESGGLCAVEYVAPEYCAEPNITLKKAAGSKQ